MGRATAGMHVGRIREQLEFIAAKVKRKHSDPSSSYHVSPQDYADDVESIRNECKKLRECSGELLKLANEGFQQSAIVPALRDGILQGAEAALAELEEAHSAQEELVKKMNKE